MGNFRRLFHFLDLLPPIGLSRVPDEDPARGGGEVDAKLKRGAAGGRVGREARRAKVSGGRGTG